METKKFPIRLIVQLQDRFVQRLPAALSFPVADFVEGPSEDSTTLKRLRAIYHAMFALPHGTEPGDTCGAIYFSGYQGAFSFPINTGLGNFTPVVFHGYVADADGERCPDLEQAISTVVQTICTQG